MKKKRFTWRYATVLIALLLATATAATACSNSGNNGANGEGAAAPSGETEVSAGFDAGKFDPPVKLTTVGCINSTFKFKEGESLENNPHIDWAKEKLGIDIKYNWVTAADQCTTKIRLDMSAGKQMPDVLYVGDPQLASDLIDSGKVMDIGEAFDKYASPEVKDIYARDPLYWAQVTKDGKRYGLPLLSNVQQNDPLLWIRTDWLKQMNMETPKTFEDLEKVMEGMLHTDFGTGAVNPPLAVSINDPNMPFVQWRGDTSWIFGGYGVIPGYWNKWQGDRLEYGSIQPETKQALAKMQEWFKKGYLSQDVGLVEVSKSDDTFRNQKSGIMTGPGFQATAVHDYLQKNNPQATADVIPVPAGPSGQAGRRDTPVPSGSLLIGKDFKHIDAFFLYINKMFEGGNPTKGSEFENGFAEGYDYIMKDGKVVTDQEEFPDKTKVNVVKYFLGNQPFVDPELELQAKIKFYNGEKPSTPFEERLYNGVPEDERSDPQNVLVWKAAKITYDQRDVSIKNLFLGPQTATMKSKWEGLMKMESETFLKIIYNKASIDEFDTFVKNWKSMGGDKITDEVNEWYQSTIGQ